MKAIPTLIVTFAGVFLISISAYAQSASLPCPPPEEDCPGTCNFSATLSASGAGGSCNGSGYAIVVVTLTDGVDSGGEDTDCESNVERASAASAITYTLCDPPLAAGTQCTLGPQNFPNDGAWPPYGPGSNPPAGKVALSADCFNAVTAQASQDAAGNDVNSYIFTGVAHVSVNISMTGQCICGTDTASTTFSLEDETPELPMPNEARYNVSANNQARELAESTSPLGQPTTLGSSIVTMNLRPNPFFDKIAFDAVAKSAQPLYIDLYAIDGSKVISNVRLLPEGQSSQELNIGVDLPAGAYFLRLTSNEANSVFKLIKE